MTTRVIDRRIEKLQFLKDKMLKGTLTSEELVYIYDSIFKRYKVIRCDSYQGFTHFYVDKEDGLCLIKELEDYEEGIIMHRTNSKSISTTPVFNFNGKVGAGFIQNITGEYVPVYDPIYHSCICADGNYIHLIDDKKLDYESIVTQSSDVYRIRHRSKYLEDFTVRRENATDNNNAIVLDVLYYDQRPVYICDLALDSKEVATEFFDSRSIVLNDAFESTLRNFDDDFMNGNYGPQKTFK